MAGAFDLTPRKLSGNLLGVEQTGNPALGQFRPYIFTA